jgi:hypothetical protein
VQAALDVALANNEVRLAHNLYYLTGVTVAPPVAAAHRPTDEVAPAREVMPDKRRRFIGWWQIICGALGLVAYALSMVDVPRGSLRVIREVTGYINVGVGMLFFAACVAFGILLLRGERRGVLGSVVCQALQVVSFSFVGGPHVLIQSGPKVGLTLAADTFRAEVGFTSAFFLGTRMSGVAWVVSLNILAIVWTTLLIRFAREQAQTSPEPPVAEPVSSDPG